MKVFVFEPHLKEIELSPEYEWREGENEDEWLVRMGFYINGSLLLGDLEDYAFSYSLYAFSGRSDAPEKRYKLIRAEIIDGEAEYFLLHSYKDFLAFMSQIFPLYAVARGEHRAELLFRRENIE